MNATTKATKSSKKPAPAPVEASPTGRSTPSYFLEQADDARGETRQMLIRLGGLLDILDDGGPDDGAYTKEAKAEASIRARSTLLTAMTADYDAARWLRSAKESVAEMGKAVSK